MLLCADLLETVKKKFNQVDAICRVKDCIYLQVITFVKARKYFMENMYELRKCLGVKQ